jgi:uncharacterized phage protein (TIGR02220 family)
MNWPFIKFYPRDWQADPELRMCSLESRGFWIECLCIMHSAKRRGYLETPQGQPLTDDHTARLMATFKGDLLRCKEELLLHGVPSVEDGTGVWYCRRMVKETQKAEKCSESGRRGGGNPNINKENINKEDIPEARSHISLKVTFKGRDFLEVFNEITGRSFRILDKKAAGQLSARMKEGFTEDEIIKAIKNCMSDEYHKQNPKFLTPEFITRADKLQKFLNSEPPKPAEPSKATGWGGIPYFDKNDPHGQKAREAQELKNV